MGQTKLKVGQWWTYKYNGLEILCKVEKIDEENDYVWLNGNLELAGFKCDKGLFPFSLEGLPFDPSFSLYSDVI